MELVSHYKSTNWVYGYMKHRAIVKCDIKPLPKDIAALVSFHIDNYGMWNEVLSLTNTGTWKLTWKCNLNSYHTSTIN